MEEKVLVVVVEAEVQMNECNLVLLLLLLEPKFGVRQEESKKIQTVRKSCLGDFWL